ncbi:hypothetical protein ACHAW5_005696 [Stephanodiscus triporus]|uniref:Protein LTV1 homolog n=1 Tax=Stephanodiscus triporus TaxID=2934178 RepID=A0ABD3NJW9_9STRA
MGKKKPFIDKKTAMVYHVVRRSLRDVGTEATADDLREFVLMPSPENAVRRAAGSAARAPPPSLSSSSSSPPRGGTRKGVVDFRTLEARVAAAGLLDETATTYARHTRPIDRSGTYVRASLSDAPNLDDGLLTDASKNVLDEALEEAMAVREVGRMLESIALTPDCMDEDVAAALFGEDDDEWDFEELDDDFCLAADREEAVPDDENDDDDNGGGGFDFERHVKMLMERARAREGGGGDDHGARGRTENDFFDGVAPLRGRMEGEGEDEDEDDFDYDRYVEEEEEEDDDEEEGRGDDNDLDRDRDGERQRVLCRKFEEALLEYDSDEMGDLDDECEDIVGDRPLEGDACLEAALDEFLTEREDEILIEGRRGRADGRRRAGGSGYSALVGKTMVNASELDGTIGADPSSSSLLVNVEESKRQMQMDLAEADAILANPEMDLPPEEVFIDGKSYFSVTSRNPWDCESILSTYSNLDNNPVIIGRSERRRKKKGSGRGRGDASMTSNGVIPEDGPVRIRLSNKTGLPLRAPEDDGNAAADDDHFGGEGDTYLSVNRGEARHKDETKEEKRGRKMAVKEERKICRMQKKIMKEAFAEEFQKRGHDTAVDPVGGKTVFRFS